MYRSRQNQYDVRVVPSEYEQVNPLANRHEKLAPSIPPLGSFGRCEERYSKEPHSDAMRFQPTPKYKPAATTEAVKARNAATTFRMRIVWRTA